MAGTLSQPWYILCTNEEARIQTGMSLGRTRILDAGFGTLVLLASRPSSKLGVYL